MFSICDYLMTLSRHIDALPGITGFEPPAHAPAVILLGNADNPLSYLDKVSMPALPMAKSLN
jgi:hypothetical protein